MPESRRRLPTSCFSRWLWPFALCAALLTGCAGDNRMTYDPFIGMGLILNLLAETGKKLSETVAELPAYTIVKDKYTLKPDRLPELYAALEQRWPEAKANCLDGLRLDWEDRWVHVRPSNTEPIVRVIAEAPEAEPAKVLCRAVGVMLPGL